MQPNRFEEAKPNPKAEIMLLTEHLQRNPTYKKGQGRPLPARGNPLTDVTTVKLNRKLQAERVWKVCFARFIQSTIYPP